MKLLSHHNRQSRSRTLPVLVLAGRSLLTVVALLASNQAAMAQDASQDSSRTYRCVVLGDNAACPAPIPQSPVRIEERVDLGPVAKYYVYLGMDRRDALERASASGEQATRRLVRVTTKVLTAAEKYDSLMGDSSHTQTTEETVVGTVDRGCEAAEENS